MAIDQGCCGNTRVPYKIKVYLDDGRVFIYDVDNESSAREHADAIVQGGYRHMINNGLETYPTHRIRKVKIVGFISTNYVDYTEGT